MSREALTAHEGQKYLRRINSAIGDSAYVSIDVYEVLLAFNVTCPATAHAVKKLLCAGIRGKGDRLADLKGAMAALNRAIDFEERLSAQAPPEVDVVVAKETPSDYVDRIRESTIWAADEELCDKLKGCVDLVETDEVNSLIGDTNACGFGLDQLDLHTISFTKAGCVALIDFYISGEHDADKMFHGSSIVGEVELTVNRDGIASYRMVRAEMDPKEYDDNLLDNIKDI